MEGGSVGHNFERDPPKNHPCQVWFNLVQRFQRRRLKCESLRRTTDGQTDDGRTDGRRRTTDAKWWQKLTWPLARWAKNPYSDILKWTIKDQSYSTQSWKGRPSPAARLHIVFYIGKTLSRDVSRHLPKVGVVKFHWPVRYNCLDPPSK